VIAARGALRGCEAGGSKLREGPANEKARRVQAGLAHEMRLSGLNDCLGGDNLT
jgi:hypothetical protein